MHDGSHGGGSTLPMIRVIPPTRRPVDFGEMNSPAKDALRLKMAGLIFTLAGLVAVMVLGDKMGGFEKPVAAAPRDYVFIAGAWLVAAHFVAFGLIVLLAGLNDVPLLTSARARRGVMQKASRFHPDYSVLRICGSYGYTRLQVPGGVVVGITTQLGTLSCFSARRFPTPTQRLEVRRRVRRATAGERSAPARDLSSIV